VTAKRESPDLPFLPETAETLVLELEGATGRKRLRLLNAGSQFFRGDLFNALLDRARARLEAEGPAGAETDLDMAVYLARNAANENEQANCLFAIGSVWHDSGQLAQAIPAYRKAARIFGQAEEFSGEARVRARLGQAQAAIGELPEALRSYHCALHKAQSINDVRLVAQIKNNLGNAYRQANDYHRAYSSFMQAIEGAQAVSDPELECTARGNLGLTEFELGQYAQAESTLRDAVTCAQRLDNKRLEASHTGDLGNTCRALGKLTEAEKYIRKALSLAKELADPRYEEIGLGDLGILLFQMGRANEAIPMLEQARNLSVSIGELADAAIDAYHLSTAYRDLGDSATEEAILQECLRLAEAGGEWSVKEGALHALAYKSMSKGDFVGAEKLLEEADKVRPLIIDAYNSWSSQHMWGLLARHQRKYAEAERCWEKAFKLATEARNVFGMLSALINRGNVLIMLHHLEEAKSVLHDALERAQAMSLPDDERLIWEVLGLVREQQQDFNGARACYERALALIESGRSALSLEAHRIGFLAIREGPYVRLIRLLTFTRHPASAWEMCERLRSRSLVDILAHAEIPPPSSLPDTLVQAESKLLPILRLRNFEVSQYDTRHVQVVMVEISRLQSNLQSLWEEMASLAPEYVAQRRGEILRWKDVKELL